MAATIVMLILTAAVYLAPLIAPYEFDAIDLKNVKEPPSKEHWMGTDDLGRDLFTRILYGGRISLSIGIFSALVATVFGSLMGAISGYYGGAVDNSLMRFTDIVYSIPSLPLLIVLTSYTNAAVPAMVLIIPNFLTVTWLGRIGPIPWLNNWPSLTIPFMGSVFSIFLLRQFFAQIPDELYDAARIDGAGHMRFLVQVVVPLSKAPILVIVVLSFIGAWNSLAWPLLVTSSPEWRPISVGFLNFQNEAGQELHYMMAGAVITIIPILILYFFTQKQFTDSIARSGLKG